MMAMGGTVAMGVVVLVVIVIVFAWRWHRSGSA